MGKSKKRRRTDHIHNSCFTKSERKFTSPRTKESSDSEIQSSKGKISSFFPKKRVMLSESDSDPDPPVVKPTPRRRTMVGAPPFRKHTWRKRRFTEDDSDYDWVHNPENKIQVGRDKAAATSRSEPRMTRNATRRSSMLTVGDEIGREKDDEVDKGTEEEDSGAEWQPRMTRSASKRSSFVTNRHEIGRERDDEVDGVTQREPEEGCQGPMPRKWIEEQRQREKNDEAEKEISEEVEDEDDEEGLSYPEWRRRSEMTRTAKESRRERKSRKKNKVNEAVTAAVNGERPDRLTTEIVLDDDVGETVVDGHWSADEQKVVLRGNSEKDSDDKLFLPAIRKKKRKSQQKKMKEEDLVRMDVLPQNLENGQIEKTQLMKNWNKEDTVKDKEDKLREKEEEGQEEQTSDTENEKKKEEELPLAIMLHPNRCHNAVKRRSVAPKTRFFASKSFERGIKPLPAVVVPLISLSSDEDDEQDARKTGRDSHNKGEKKAQKKKEKPPVEAPPPLQVVDLIPSPGGEVPASEVNPKTDTRLGYAFEVEEKDGVHLHEVVPPFVQPYLLPLYHPPEQRLRFTLDISEGKETRSIPVFSDDLEEREPPAPFRYIRTCVNREKWPMTKKSTISCKCSGVCKSSCPCAKFARNKGFTLLENGVAKIKGGNFYNLLIMTCGSQCSCPPSCHMRVKQDFVSNHDLEIFKRKEQNVGFGVRTRSLIREGELVAEFAGEIVSHSQMLERDAANDEYAFLVYGEEERSDKEPWTDAVKAKIPMKEWPVHSLYCDPTNFGNVARFISNGCCTNVSMFRMIENDLRVNRFRPVLVANRTIFPSEELMWDYGEKYTLKDGIQCRCNTVHCPVSGLLKNSQSLLGDMMKDVDTAAGLQHSLILKNIRAGHEKVLQEPEVPTHEMSLPAALGLSDPVAVTEGREFWAQRDHLLFKAAAALAWKNRTCARGPSGVPCASHRDDSGLTIEQIEEMRENLKSLPVKRYLLPPGESVDDSEEDEDEEEDEDNEDDEDDEEEEEGDDDEEEETVPGE